MKIYLVRHGQSEGNVDKEVHLRKADHAIDLTPEGLKQAEGAGDFLAKALMTNSWNGEVNARLWHSPYKRTNQTTDGIMSSLKRNNMALRFGKFEHPLLCEQQFGLFDGLCDDELAKQYPNEHGHYNKCQKFEGRFWARMPLGESRFDVAQRVHQAFGTFHRDAERHSVETLIVVSHGVTIRAFLMMWLHKTVEWFENEPNPNNCSIRLIDNKRDHGYVFEGYKKC
jgi:broad specificity phosphatase PhoE